MSITDVDAPSSYGPPSGPGESFDRTPPQDVAAEQSVLGGMMLSKDAIADVVEVLRGNDFYRPAHEMVYDASSTCTAGASRPTPSPSSAELTKRGELGRDGRRALPAHADLVRAHRGQRGLLRADRARAGHPAPAGGGGHPRRAARVRDRRRRRRRHRRTPPRPRSTPSPSGGSARTTCRSGRSSSRTMDEIEASGHRGEGMSGVPTGFADLDRLTNGLQAGQMIVIAARPAIGKALALDTPLATPTGWTTMGEVRVGDLVIGADGTPTRWSAATEVMTGRPCYEVALLRRLRAGGGRAAPVADRDPRVAARAPAGQLRIRRPSPRPSPRCGRPRRSPARCGARPRSAG